MNLKISVIMSVKDGEKFLKNSIDSVLNQSYKNFEFLICDDGSEDNSFQICKEYSKRDNRIVLVKNSKTIGLTKSLNNLIKISTGNIIARQDADDISAHDRFSKQLKLYKKGHQIITSRAKIYGSKKTKPRISYFLPKKTIIKKKNIFVHGTLFINKKILLNIGCYDEFYYYSQDYKLFSDLLNQGYKIKTIFKPLYIVRNDKNISTIKINEQNYFSDLVKKSQ